MKYNIIVASDPQGIIGYNGTLPWYFKEDLAFFKQQTLGSAVVMGRKTWESLLVKPLPNRLNVVVTSTILDAKYKHVCMVPNIAHFSAPIEFHAEAEGIEDTYFIGGARIYEWVSEYVKLDNIYLTLMKKTYKGDTYLPFLHEIIEEMDTVMKNEVLFDCKDYTRYRIYR